MVHEELGTLTGNWFGVPFKQKNLGVSQSEDLVGLVPVSKKGQCV